VIAVLGGDCATVFLSAEGGGRPWGGGGVSCEVDVVLAVQRDLLGTERQCADSAWRIACEKGTCSVRAGLSLFVTRYS
jgi:hypothetical protein